MLAHVDVAHVRDSRGNLRHRYLLRACELLLARSSRPGGPLLFAPISTATQHSGPRMPREAHPHGFGDGASAAAAPSNRRTRRLGSPNGSPHLQAHAVLQWTEPGTHQPVLSEVVMPAPHLKCFLALCPGHRSGRPPRQHARAPELCAAHTSRPRTHGPTRRS